MSCEIVVGEGVVLAVWGKPKKEDIDRVIEQLQLAVAQSGGPVVYITRVPEDAPAPEPIVRTYLNKIMPQVTALCSTYHVVLEGTGFLAAVKRGILVGLFQIGGRRDTFFVTATIDEVKKNVEPERQLSTRALLIRAEARGLLHGPARTTLPPFDRHLEATSRSGVRAAPTFPENIADVNYR